MKLQQGFTLIELLVVIVVMSTLASLLILNMGGIDQRRAMQARDMFLMDLSNIQQESMDQASILALSVQPATDVAQASYQVLEYIPPSTQNLMTQPWQAHPQFAKRFLPDQVFFRIESLEHNYAQARQSDLLTEQSPKLIWLGNGEVKPVRIQFYFQNKVLSQPIEIDYLGKIHAQ